MQKLNQDEKKERAILVGIRLKKETKKYSEPLEELASLAKTADVESIVRVTQSRFGIHPGTYVGKGKLEEVKSIADEVDADLIIFDDDLSPGQARKLEKIFNRIVIDRTELILHIFAAHAQTKEAKLQVELAQLEYALPRLKRMWDHLDRYEGGIGTRGPGEKQLEIDRRLIKNRIHALSKNIKIIQERKVREVETRNDNFFTVGLVGYTNAGKSTLMNQLTKADVYVQDELFATLDTRTRVWEIDEDHKALLSDTVGFIDKLPHHLVASFKATLEEASQANLLLHVIDTSHPDVVHNISVVNKVLEEIGLEHKPQIFVFNKIDLLKDKVLVGYLSEKYPYNIQISAKQGINIDQLSNKIIEILEENFVEKKVKIPNTNGHLLAWFEKNSKIINREQKDDYSIYHVKLEKARAGWVSKKISELNQDIEMQETTLS